MAHPLQGSCLENPRDGGAWWAAVYGAAQNRTRLEQPSSSSSSNGSVGKESACNAGDIGDAGLIPGLGRAPGEGNSNLLQYSCLENPMDRVFPGKPLAGHSPKGLKESDTTRHTGMLSLGPEYSSRAPGLSSCSIWA